MSSSTHIFLYVYCIILLFVMNVLVRRRFLNCVDPQCSCSFVELSVASEKIVKMHWKRFCNPQIKNDFASLSLYDAHKYFF